MSELKKYTVIGVYLDNQQRYADTFDALSSEDAEDQAVAATSDEGDLLVAGVVEGDVKVVG